MLVFLKAMFGSIYPNPYELSEFQSLVNQNTLKFVLIISNPYVLKIIEQPLSEPLLLRDLVCFLHAPACLL